MLLDIGLPGMSGHELASRLRENPSLSGLTLIALTGYGQAGDRQRSLNAGFHYHLTKPADSVQLRQLVERELVG